MIWEEICQQIRDCGYCQRMRFGLCKRHDEPYQKTLEVDSS